MKSYRTSLLLLIGVGIIFCSFIFISHNDHSNALSKAKTEPDFIKIGNQVWMTTNLNATRFRNGDIIPQTKNVDEWAQAKYDAKPAWCYYGEDSSTGKTYGRLYNWYAVTDPRGLAPVGWHIPTESEWNELINYLGGDTVAGTKLKSKSGWGENGNGTNESGFNALPGGSRDDFGSYGKLEYAGEWWSTTIKNAEDIPVLYLEFNNSHAKLYNNGIGACLSVRCIKDK